jgi:hypothetical protein
MGAKGGLWSLDRNRGRLHPLDGNPGRSLVPGIACSGGGGVYVLNGSNGRPGSKGGRTWKAKFPAQGRLHKAKARLSEWEGWTLKKGSS